MNIQPLRFGRIIVKNSPTLSATIDNEPSGYGDVYKLPNGNTSVALLRGLHLIVLRRAIKLDLPSKRLVLGEPKDKFDNYDKVQRENEKTYLRRYEVNALAKGTKLVSQQPDDVRPSGWLKALKASLGEAVVSDTRDIIIKRRLQQRIQPFNWDAWQSQKTERVIPPHVDIEANRRKRGIIGQLGSSTKAGSKI